MRTFHKLSGLIVAAVAMAACAAPPAAAPASNTTSSAAAGKLKVFAAYATPLEEPWPSIIHAALNAEKDAGTIDYRYQDDIGYKGDMEQVLRKEIEQNKPDIIMGDAFGNEEIVAKVAADNPKVAFAFGMPGGPALGNGKSGESGHAICSLSIGRLIYGPDSEQQGPRRRWPIVRKRS